jgi:leucyl aminopeptidase (aminopeptidase T)
MLQRIRNYLQDNGLFVPADLEARLKTIARQAVTLDAMRVKTLRFKADNGTDFTVELIEGTVWECGYHLNEEGELWFSVPYPGSFEMFNTPEKSSANGKIVITDSLSCFDVKSGDFIVLKDGLIVQYNDCTDAERIERLFASRRLGEIALVDIKASLYNYDADGNFREDIHYSDIIKYENKACHFATGCAYPQYNFKKRPPSPQQVNFEGWHCDYLFGDSTIEVYATSFDNVTTKIMEQGCLII